MEDEGEYLAAFFVLRFTVEIILAMQQLFAMVIALSDEEEKQEENDGVTLSSKSIIVGNGGIPVDDGDGDNGRRNREDFSIKVLSEVVLLAHGTEGERFDGSIAIRH
eukprot:6873539-Ditylum_brightwellii.AAC.1